MAFQSHLIIYILLLLIIIGLVDTRCSTYYTDTDIPGNDLTSQVAQLSSCPSICQSYTGCMAFVWNSTNGGTCYLKSSNGPLVYLANSYASIMVQDWYCSQTFSGRDLPGNDLTNQSGQWSDCCKFCRANPACKAVTWNNTNNGTCWLKSAVGGMVANSKSQAAIILPGSIPNCTGYWDNEIIDAAKATYSSVTNEYYLPVRNIDSCSFANTYCQNLGGNMVSIHSSAENALVTQVAFTYNINAYIGMYRNPPSSNPTGGIWTDGTPIDYTNWNGGEPNDAGGIEVCVNIFSGTAGCGGYAVANGTYVATNGKWNDINAEGVYCNVYAVVCELQCTTAQFPIDGSCPFTTSQISTISQAMTQSNFNSFLPILMSIYPVSVKANMSWDVTDIFSWAAFERTELNLTEDLFGWYDNSMGNCFTFNHFDNPKIYMLRYAGEYGGFRAMTIVNQADALEWAYTSSLLVFFHERNTIPNGNSVSYNIAPGEETTFTIKRNDYTRLGPPYGRCIHNKNEVKSFYSVGDYNIDSCFDSCYQDYVYETCGCMDPRFITENNVILCNMTQLDCFANITAIRGEPSTWPECSCPQPCNETKYVVSWSKTVYRTFPTECNPDNQTTFANCTAMYQNEYAMFNAYVPVYGYYVFVETPEYTFQDILNSFNNLTGLLLGISVVSFFEILSLLINLSYVLRSKAPVKNNIDEDIKIAVGEA